MKPSTLLVTKAYKLYLDSVPMIQIQCTDEIIETKILGLYPEHFKLFCYPKTKDENRLLHVDDLCINASEMKDILNILETQYFPPIYPSIPQDTTPLLFNCVCLKFLNKFGLYNVISLLLKSFEYASADVVIDFLYVYHSLSIPVLEYYGRLITNLRSKMECAWSILLAKRGENPRIEGIIYKHICTLEPNNFKILDPTTIRQKKRRDLYEESCLDSGHQDTCEECEVSLYQEDGFRCPNGHL